MRVAIVGFGGARTSIICEAVEILEKISYYDNIALYIVNNTVKLEKDVIFYEYYERRELVKELLDYDWVIMTSGLGGRGWKFVSLRQ